MDGVHPKTLSHLEAALAAYGPRLPLPRLVYEVNRLFHAHEAHVYDELHQEFDAQCPILWREMVELARATFPEARWTILDFGCGTGFASEQLIKHLTPAAIEHLTCFDPSPEMLARCRDKLWFLGDRVRFTCDWSQLAVTPRRYNLIATNSVLHHLPDPIATAQEWVSLAAPEALWLAGHEPSPRYYRNPACRQAYAEFVHWRKRRQRWSPGRWLRRLASLVRRPCNSARQAAREAERRGWFAARPSPRLISRLVDLHVPHDGDPNSGFDFDEMQAALEGVWKRTWVKTYGFLGRFYDGRLPSPWSERSAALAREHPLDGARFCAVWRRA